MSSRAMLEKIENTLVLGGPQDPPAYTLVLGSGASYGIVPTAREMLGIPAVGTSCVHPNCIPHWLHKSRGQAACDTDDARLECSRKFWAAFSQKNPDCKVQLTGDGLPDARAIDQAYKAVFNTRLIGGLDSPELHQRYLRQVALGRGTGKAHLNATHFYLASLLSLQHRKSQERPDDKALYIGRRDFARTIFTTNFDPLLQISLQLFQQLYYMTDRPESLSADALQTDDHAVLHLFYAHGSIHRQMANTDDQIAQLTPNASALASYLGSHGVIVLGYSGWDDCLLEALQQTYRFQNNLYWLARGRDSISKAVEKLLVTHSDAYWVPIEDGGAFMAELHRRLCPGAPHTELLQDPIAPLLRQLGSVSLVGILDSKPSPWPEGTLPAVAEKQATVEEIRGMVVKRLEDAQGAFLSPTDWEERFRQAELSYANGNWGEALKAYDELLNGGYPMPPEIKAIVLVRRGVCYGQKGETVKAIADYSTVIGMPKAPAEQVARARYNRGVSHGEQGQSGKAIADYTAVIKMPGAPAEEIARARINRGFFHSKKGENGKAIADYSAVIEMPERPASEIANLLYNRAVWYGREGESGKAMADYTAVIDMPEAPAELIAKARRNRGLRYEQEGESGKAMADYRAVIEMPGAPTEQIAKARLNRGFCYEEQGKTEEAIADYSVLIEMPNAPTEQIAAARVNRGISYGEKGEIGKANADFTAVIGMPDAPTEQIAKARFLRGISYEQEGEIGKAIGDFTAVTELPGVSVDLVDLAKEKLRQLNEGEEGDPPA